MLALLYGCSSADLTPDSTAPVVREEKGSLFFPGNYEEITTLFPIATQSAKKTIKFVNPEYKTSDHPEVIGMWNSPSYKTMVTSKYEGTIEDVGPRFEFSALVTVRSKERDKQLRLVFDKMHDVGNLFEDYSTNPKQFDGRAIDVEVEHTPFTQIYLVAALEQGQFQTYRNMTRIPDAQQHCERANGTMHRFRDSMEITYVVDYCVSRPRPLTSNEQALLPLRAEAATYYKKAERLWGKKHK